MFGLFRLYLALAVVAHHLLRVPEVGGAAVFAFFTLSGFLMTNIVTETYGYSPKGFATYLFNRFLRLFPSYWIVILLSLVIIAITGESFAKAYNHALGIPRSWDQWLMNLTMIFPSDYPNRIGPRLFPIVWTLTVEIFYYVLIGLGITRTKLATMLFLAAGLAYHGYGLWTGRNFDFHYHSIFAGALPFAAGGLTYHLRDQLARLADRATACLAAHGAVLGIGALAFYVNVVVLHHDRWAFAGKMIDLGVLAATIVLSAVTIGALYRARAFIISRALDTLLGKFSYPVYLMHLQASLIVSFLFFGHTVAGANVPGITGFMLAMVLTLMVSWGLIRFVEPAIDRLRDRVKRNQRQSSPHQADHAANGKGPGDRSPGPFLDQSVQT